MASVQRILKYVRACRSSTGVQDAEFAAAIGVSLIELQAFDAGEAKVPIEVLNAMLRWASDVDPDTGSKPPGMSDRAAPYVAGQHDRARTLEGAELMRAYAAIDNPEWRRMLIDLAVLMAQRGGGA